MLWCEALLPSLPAEKTPSPKASLPILTVLPPSSSSSNRRSSGRNHGVHELSACERLTVELVRHEDSWPFIKLVSRTQVHDHTPVHASHLYTPVHYSLTHSLTFVNPMFSCCLKLPDYYEIIQRPIALSIIREKVNNCEYKTSGENRIQRGWCGGSRGAGVVLLEGLVWCVSDLTYPCPCLAAQYMEDVELMFSNCLQYNPRHTNEAKAGVRLQNFYHSELTKLGLSLPRDPAPKRTRM